jgi:NAD(P)-dependent dehydrogenase (short-subunit alcohol dehydrogenase family)
MDQHWGYNGKICVVTGASSGMGKATAALLVELGAQVYALDRSAPSVEGLTQAITVDLGDRASIDAAFAQLPTHIDCFFGVAGVTGHSTDFTTTFQIDFTANKYMVETYLLDRVPQGGSLTFVTSAGGLRWEHPGWRDSFLDLVQAENWEDIPPLIEKKGLTEQPGKLGYPLAKRALNYYLATLALRLAPQHIRVNALLPGSTDTAMTPDFVRSLGSMERLVKFSGDAGRLATPEEMAYPLVFLGSDLASYITGVHLVADYGLNTAMILGEKPDVYAPRS